MRGLVGLPNAGKSTFLSAVSAAKPKIADYPFTTLHPNLGVVDAGETSFVLADIPGLIEGAHDGAGLGDRFLGHVERTSVLLHLVDGTEEDVASSYQTIREELAAYGGELAQKPEIVALTKCDALDDETMRERAATLAAVADCKPLLLSSVSGRGVREAIYALSSAISEDRRKEQDDAETKAAWQPSTH